MAMCAGCPFRTPGETRTTLLRYISAAPDESWPCHEADGLCLSNECEGRRMFAKVVERIKQKETQHDSRKRPTPNPYDLSEATHNYAGRRIKPKRRKCD